MTTTEPPAAEYAPRNIVALPLELIDPSPRNPRQRFEEGALTELAESIRAHGVLQPILVRPKARDRYSIIAGERRVRASLEAGRTTIPAIVRADLGDVASLKLAL